MSVVVPKGKIIDKTRSNGIPVSPKKMVILLMSFLLGLILPILVIAIRDMLRYHIDTKEELEKLSTVPVLGEIPRSADSGTVIIKAHNTDSFTEMVRLVRSNLLFIMNDPDKKVINIESSISGEGKTFVSINLAMSLALLDKKVIILGLDIRKPKLGEYLGLDNQEGVTLYLSGHLAQDKLIRPSGIHPNLSVITAGPVPPNPNELLAKPALEKLITELRASYDYVVIDTAPMGVVSDSFTLNRYADVSLYVVRAGYTPKRCIEDATILYKREKVKNMYFLLNSVEPNKKSYQYGYGRKYGYGYGKKQGTVYGYGE
jgi:capsular exopolysaccharide synthesis family protein